MRFLILTQYFPPEVGAPQVRMAALAHHLLRLGHEVEVVTGMPNYPSARIFPEYRGRLYSKEQWENSTVHRSWLYASKGAGIRRMVSFTSFALTSLLGLMRSKRPDYIYVNSPPLFLSIPAWIASTLWRVPIIFCVADLWPDSARELRLIKNETLLKVAEVLERWTYRRARFVTATTEGIQDTLIGVKGVPAEKVLLLLGGVDTEVFKPLPPNTALAEKLGLAGKQIVLYAGTHGFAHGLEVALHAATLLRDTNIHFVLIGGGSEKDQLVKTAKEMNLPNLLFLDPAPPEYVAQLHSIALAGLSTLRSSPLFEGTRPAKMFVTMAAAKPLLYSGSGEGAKLLEQTKAGMVVPPEDPQALVNAILSLANHPDQAKQMGENGRRYVENHLSWGALIEQWLGQLPSPKPRN
jgi:glycosyltransferase involved in cell wall biosynthesis